MTSTDTTTPAHRKWPAAERWVRIGLRTGHLTAMAYLVGGVSAGLPLDELPWATRGILVTGLLYVGVELLTSRVWLYQMKGQAVLIKLFLFATAFIATEHSLPLFLAALVIGGVSSHMPSRFRYYSIWHGRVVR